MRKLLKTIVEHRLCDAIRRECGSKRGSVNHLEKETERMIDREEGLVSPLEKLEAQETLERLFAHLDAQQRSILMLRLDDHTEFEIADILGCSVGNVHVERQKIVRVAEAFYEDRNVQKFTTKIPG
jgi:RNA polymerase sigma factor (sigma-70 family)